MNSLVVLLSVVALATAKPSGLLDAGVLTYSAPIVAAAPAAVSHQSRVDIKSSPAVISTVAAAPVAYTAPVATAPVAPIVAAAPAAVSHQSRVDIKSSPAVISTVATAPVAYTAPVTTAVVAPAAFAAPAVYRSAVVAPWTVAAPAVPLDTPEVVAARVAHFQAKALAAHSIHKRSVVAAAPLVSTYAAAPITYTAPIAYTAPVAHVSTYAVSAPVVTRAYGVHPW